MGFFSSKLMFRSSVSNYVYYAARLQTDKGRLPNRQFYVGSQLSLWKIIINYFEIIIRYFLCLKSLHSSMNTNSLRLYRLLIVQPLCGDFNPRNVQNCAVI